MSVESRFKNALDENRRTIKLLESLEPVRPEDVADRDKQLNQAKKLRDLMTRIDGAIFGDVS